MTDETGSPAGSEAIFSTELPADAPETFNTPREAAEYFTNLKAKKAEPAESAEPVKDATADNELSKDNPESPEQETTEGDEETEPAKPAIDPPKSWTKDLHEHWANLDPVLQERIVARDREDQAAIKRAFNEAAEQRKVFETERQQAEKVRQEYEAKLPELVKQIHQQGPFADIKSQDDADALAQNDPFRYLQWDAYQKRLAGMAHEAREVEVRQTQERQSQWASHVQKENELAAEYIPDLADKVKGPALTNRVATELLPELGFKDSELADLASGKSKLSIYDHRVQRLLADAVKLRDIQAAPKAVSAKPLPPVQKPGTSKPAGSEVSAKLQALEATFNKTGNLRDAQALYAAQLEAQTRRRAS